ncbi:MAG: NADP-dependent oxidoreductase [Blastomonas sp.]
MAKAWTLKSRPAGMPNHENFELVDLPDAPLGPNQVRVANSWLSVDPYMRGRMVDRESYVPPFQIGEPMQGGAVGRIIESNHPDYAEGDLVQHMAGWRDVSVAEPMAMLTKLPETGLPDHLWLSNMGLTGATAWFGLMKVASAKPDDVVFVSAAAGAVGSAVIQIAKAKGMKAIGSAGGPEKCAWVRELGADACIDYKAGPVLPQLREAAPNGISVYFDNVGGEHLDAALACSVPFSRYAMCGMIEVYNDFEKGVSQEMHHLMMLVGLRINMRGFIVSDFMADFPEFHQDMGAMIAAGAVKSRETVMDGIESMPDAFLGLFSGKNTGKMLVKV